MIAFFDCTVRESVQPEFTMSCLDTISCDDINVVFAFLLLRLYLLVDFSDWTEEEAGLWRWLCLGDDDDDDDDDFLDMALLYRSPLL